MCGIVGIVANNARVSSEMLERATLSLAHRGPDDSGTIIFHKNEPSPIEVGLGSRRLAVLDLSSLGHQPMHDADTGNWIVHNGEIYNFREIREQLERDGVQFHSHSDTEVVLKAYARWSESCVDRLRGMFAFAIWDEKRRRMFLARDPMGIKPLYYAVSTSHFMFASEVRTFLRAGLVAPRLDSSALFSYLTFGSVYEPSTIVEGVKSVSAGHYVIWEDGNVRDAQYWDMVSKHPGRGAPPAAPPEDRPGAEAEIHAALEESVRMQMVSDVPVGVFLSGGIDSSAIVGLLARSGIRPNTFSIVFREADFSEAEFSRMVARQFETDHQEIFVSQNNALEAIPAALSAMDQPSIDGLNTYLISRQTRAAGIKVAISGLGGDELFGGYGSFRTVPAMERMANRWQHLPGFAQRSLASIFSTVSAESDRNRKLAELAETRNGLHPYFLSRMLFTETQSEQLAPSTKAGAAEAVCATLRATADHARGLDPVNRVSFLESRCYMLNTLLRDSDSMSMAHGLELRVPLIDHVLARKLLALPGAWKLSDAMPKPILVNALGNALPAEVVKRPKRGFTLPFEHWLRDQLGDEVGGTLGRVGGESACGLSGTAVASIWKDFQNGATSWSRPWSLFVLLRWCELNGVSA